jgi:hypothetical protein
MKHQLSLPDDIVGPEFIKLRDGEEEVVWLDQYLTVAQWRLAQQFAVKGDTQHTLRQFRMATLMLERADRDGLPEDAVLCQRSSRCRHWVEGADGIVRYRDKLKKPNLSVVENPLG